MTLTKEWLQQTISELEEERDATTGAVNEDAAMALAAMKLALASLEAEPIYQLWDEGYYDTQKETYDAVLNAVGTGVRGRIVYTAPPAASADEGLLHMAASAIEDLLSNKDRSGAGVWSDIPGKLRRAAMLQWFGNSEQLEPVTTANKFPDGWVACSERMPEETGDIIVVSDGIVMSGISYSRKKGFYMAALEYDDDEQIEEVTHWMPLPAAPQQEA